MATFWERAAHSVAHMFFLYFDYLLFELFPVLALIVPVPGHCLLVTLLT